MTLSVADHCTNRGMTVQELTTRSGLDQGIEGIHAGHHEEFDGLALLLSDGDHPRKKLLQLAVSLCISDCLRPLRIVKHVAVRLNRHVRVDQRRTA